MQVKAVIKLEGNPQKLAKLKTCGQLLHCFDEIWFFLLHAKYVKLTGAKVELPKELV
jgi:hypothetical protein